MDHGHALCPFGESMAYLKWHHLSVYYRPETLIEQNQGEFCRADKDLLLFHVASFFNLMVKFNNCSYYKRGKVFSYPLTQRITFDVCLIESMAFNAVFNFSVISRRPVHLTMLSQAVFCFTHLSSKGWSGLGLEKPEKGINVVILTIINVRKEPGRDGNSNQDPIFAIAAHYRLRVTFKKVAILLVTCSGSFYYRVL